MDVNQLISETTKRIRGCDSVMYHKCTAHEYKQAKAEKEYYQAILKILNAVEREAVATQVNPEEVFLQDLKENINAGMSKNDLKTLINQRLKNRG